MISNPIIVSMPHSGTRFLKERLGIADHVHTTVNWRMLEKRTQGRSIIVPLRKPESVWRSWCRRHDHDNFPHANFFLGWGALHALDQLHELDVICVDKCEDPRITDWTPVGDGDGSRARWKLLKMDLRQLYKLPIVTRNYGAHSE